jgi:hypothetical protein
MRFSPFVILLCVENAFGSTLAPETDPLGDCKFDQGLAPATTEKFNAMFKPPHFFPDPKLKLICLLLQFDSRIAEDQPVEAGEVVKGIVMANFGPRLERTPRRINPSPTHMTNHIRVDCGFKDPAESKVAFFSELFVGVILDFTDITTIQRYCELFKYLHLSKAATEIIDAELQKLG